MPTPPDTPPPSEDMATSPTEEPVEELAEALSRVLPSQDQPAPPPSNNLAVPGAVGRTMTRWNSGDSGIVSDSSRRCSEYSEPGRKESMDSNVDGDPSQQANIELGKDGSFDEDKQSQVAVAGSIAMRGTSRRCNEYSEPGQKLATFELGGPLLEDITEDSGEEGGSTLYELEPNSNDGDPERDATSDEDKRSQDAAAGDNSVKTARSRSLCVANISLPSRKNKPRRFSLQSGRMGSLPTTKEKLKQIAAQMADAIIGVAHTRTFSSPVVMVSRSTGEGNKRRRHSEVNFKTYFEMPFDMFRVSSLAEIRKMRIPKGPTLVPPRERRITATGEYKQYTAEAAFQEQRIKDTIEANVDLFYKYINWGEILRYLQSYGLLNSTSLHLLMSQEHSRTHKSNYFFHQALPSMGGDAYRRFYRCLKCEVEHLGHRDLAAIIRRALSQ